jgi:hypothetical protein
MHHPGISCRGNVEACLERFRVAMRGRDEVESPE